MRTARGDMYLKTRLGTWNDKSFVGVTAGAKKFAEIMTESESLDVRNFHFRAASGTAIVLFGYLYLWLIGRVNVEHNLLPGFTITRNMAT